jgi:hypothetical protein
MRTQQTVKRLCGGIAYCLQEAEKTIVALRSGDGSVEDHVRRLEWLIFQLYESWETLTYLRPRDKDTADKVRDLVRWISNSITAIRCVIAKVDPRCTRESLLEGGERTMAFVAYVVGKVRTDLEADIEADLGAHA